MITCLDHHNRVPMIVQVQPQPKLRVSAIPPSNLRCIVITITVGYDWNSNGHFRVRNKRDGHDSGCSSNIPQSGHCHPSAKLSICDIDTIHSKDAAKLAVVISNKPSNFLKVIFSIRLRRNRYRSWNDATFLAETLTPNGPQFDLFKDFLNIPVQDVKYYQ